MESPIAHVIPEVIANLLIPIVLVVIIFIMDWRIGVANLLTIPLGLLFFMMMMRGYEEKSKRYQEASKAMNTTMVEYVNGIKVIKAFNKSASSFGKFKETVNENKKAMLDWYLSVCFSMTGAMETIPATMIFVLPTSLYLFMQGSVEMSLLIMCILLSYASYKPLIKAMSHLETMANIKIVMKEINKVMEIPDLERGKQLKHIKSYDVEFQNVSFAYDESKNVLNNVSFSMKKGEILGVLGKSGAGKSTIGKILLQLSRPTTGTILFEGKTLSEVPRKDIQAIFQDPYSALNPSLKIGEILEEPLIANGRFLKEERRKKVEETLVKVGLLESDYEKYPEELSGGQQQRVCIAGAIILSPKLIICDEPIASLDLAIQVQILDLIHKINQEEGISFIFITHNLPAVYRIADRILLLYHGEVQEIQEAEEFFRNPKSEYGKKFLQHLNLTKNVTNVTDFFI